MKGKVNNDLRRDLRLAGVRARLNKVAEELEFDPDRPMEPTEEAPGSVRQAPAPSAGQASAGVPPEDTDSTEQTKFMSDEIENMLSQQIGNEMSAFYEYTGVRAWFGGLGLRGFEAWAKKQACDEMAHMNKILDYMVEAGVAPQMPPVSDASAVFGSVEDSVEAIFKREKEVTANWRAIAKKALQDGDAGTLDLAQCFIKEQMEEEDNVKSVHTRLGLGEGILVVDLQLLEQYGG